MTFQDIYKSSFLENIASISILDMAIAMVLAFLLLSLIHILQDAYGEKYDSLMMFDSKRDVAILLHEKAEARSVRERLRQKQQTKTQRQRKPKHYKQER